MHVAYAEMKSVLTGALVFYVLLFSLCEAREFNTYAEPIVKRTSWVPYVVRKTCLLIPDRGPCRANIQMYYYDPQAQKCDTFYWGGCMGNGNRFETSAQCNTSCLSQPNVKPNAPRWCQLAFDYGFCFGEIHRYYYDRFWRVCKSALYSGCGGNRNNFYSLAQCEQVCRFGNEKISVLPKKSGIKKVLIINPTTTPKYIIYNNITTEFIPPKF